MTTQHFARHGVGMSDTTDAARQRPEGALIERARKLSGLSGRQAAKESSLSDSRWRQIINGNTTVGGQVVPVVGPDDTIARMARAVGVTPDQLRAAGRPEAADALLTLSGMQAESEWESVGTALDRLLSIREQIDAVIAELRAAPAPTTPAAGVTGTPPQVEVGEPDA